MGKHLFICDVTKEEADSKQICWKNYTVSKSISIMLLFAITKGAVHIFASKLILDPRKKIFTDKFPSNYYFTNFFGSK